MRILGITDGQTSGAAVIEDGRILAAINEERIVRIKLARGFPWQAIQEALLLSGTDPKTIEGVAVAQVNMEFREKVSDWPGWFEARRQDRDLHTAFFKVAARFGGVAARIPLLKQAYYGLRSPAFEKRRRRIGQILREEFGISAKVEFFNHHFAHATSAYYTSNFENALVVTMDGGGDGHSSHIYSVRDGKFEQLASVDSFDSLGNYYAYVTALCGFKAKRHEGKITGLAARGRPVHLDLLESMIAYEDGGLVNRGRVLFGRALEELGSRLGEGWKREDLSASIQQHSEHLVKKYVGYWQRKTGHRNVALAGGLFANVRINEEVHELPGVRSIFVHPGMTDEGIAVGAGLALERRRSSELGSPHKPQRLENVYLGNEYGENEISDALRRAGLQAEHHPGSIESVVADRLAEGKVVARFDGRMEYGPRALGNRSILYQPGDPSVNDWLNELLRRTEFMPFAPSCLHEETHRLFENATGAEDSARFMTITFHCTPWMAERCLGVVHVDTEVPVIINTSFNIHEEPIVRTPDDAIRAFLDSALDYMAAGDFLIKGPVGSSATRKKWEGKSKWGTAVHAPTSR